MKKLALPTVFLGLLLTSLAAVTSAPANAQLMYDARQNMGDVIYGTPEPMNPMLLPAIHPQDNRSHVSAVQAELRARGYRISIDGKYGPKTRAAVKKFQKSKGLYADGIIGPETLSALGVSQIY